MARIVLGGGLSGLSAGYYALKRTRADPVVLLETSGRLGGWLKSTTLEDGTIFEQSARTIRPGGMAGANTLQLVEELGLSDEIVTVSRSSDAATNRMIYVNGKLFSLPNSFLSMFKKYEPFSKPLIFSILKDLRTPKKYIHEQDESLYSFVARRFGYEIAEYLVSPMVCGVCGGNAKEISVKFLMKSFFEKEQMYGNVTRGLIAEFFKHNRPKFPKSNLLKRARDEKWNVYSFRKGIEVLPLSLKHKLEIQGADIKTNIELKDLEIKKKSVVCHTSNGTAVVGKHLVSCIPAQALGKLLVDSHPKLSKILSSFQCASMCVVNLKFSKKILNEDAFGFLVAPKENSPILGVIYDSCCFPQGDSTILTCMIGGYKYNQYITENTTENEAVNIALRELKKILNIYQKPDSSKVSFLPNCIPQYTVGHTKKVEDVEEYIRAHDLALSIAGASYYGVGVNDVIFSAKKAIESIP